MSWGSAIQTVSEVMDIARGAVDLGQTLMGMVASGDVERIDEILPAESRTRLAKELADAKARAKFGPRPEPQG